MRREYWLVPLLSRVALGASLVIIAACAGNGEGLDANGQPIGSDSGSIPLSADFDSIQANIFTPICSVCHVGGGAPEGLRLDAADSYNLLVGVPSTEVPTLLRVKPGDPADSYIIQKLQGHAAVGAQMPFGGPYLSSTTIAFIQQWITNGAPPSAAAAAAEQAPFAITAIVPDGAEPVNEPPPQIMIAFNHDLDATQLDSEAAQIEKLAPGALQTVTEEIPARIGVTRDNLKALMIWPARPLVAGQYRVVMLMNSRFAGRFADTAGGSLRVAQDSAGNWVIASFDVQVQP
jgi:hypothetical protein